MCVGGYVYVLLFGYSYSLYNLAFFSFQVMFYCLGFEGFVDISGSICFIRKSLKLGGYGGQNQEANWIGEKYT